MPPRKTSLTKRLGPAPRGRKPPLVLVPDATNKNPLVEQEPVFRTRANVDHQDFGMAVNQAGSFDYLRGSAIDEITSSRGLTGPAHDDKIRRAIRYLRETLQDRESVTLILDAAALVFVLPGTFFVAGLIALRHVGGV